MDVTGDERWYEDFFQGLALDLWQAAVTPEQTRAEMDFVLGALNAGPGATMLDVPCGPGRHALEAASRGYRVTGVDLSEEAIARARTQAGADEVEWVRADMRELPAGRSFDGAWCLGNSFGYLPPPETKDFVGAVAGALRPGARFVMDTGLAAESVLPRLQEREEATIGDFTFIEESRYLPESSCIAITYTFIKGVESCARRALHGCTRCGRSGSCWRRRGSRSAAPRRGSAGSRSWSAAPT